MRLQPTEHFGRDYERLPQRLRQRVAKALGLLLENPSHPSLQIKKIKGDENRWRHPFDRARSGDQHDPDRIPGAVAQAVEGLVHLVQRKAVGHRPGEVELS